MTTNGTMLKRRGWVVMLGLVVGVLFGVRNGLAQQVLQVQSACPQPESQLQQPCHAVNFAAPFPIWGVDSAAGCGCAEVGWDARGNIPWQEFAQGEYVGHARAPHVPEYRIREGDLIAVYYRRTREELSRPYELQVGDRIRVESLTAGRGTTSQTSPGGGDAQPTDDSISRELVI